MLATAGIDPALRTDRTMRRLLGRYERGRVMADLADIIAAGEAKALAVSQLPRCSIIRVMPKQAGKQQG